MTVRNRTVLVLVVVALGLTACGNDGPITVADAAGRSGDVEVEGFIVATADATRLCEVLAESFPPQCGGASIDVVGLDLSTLDGVESNAGTTWTSDFVTLSGTLAGGVLTVSS